MQKDQSRETVTILRARCMKYLSVDNRTLSFYNWPPDLKTPKVMARAGFVYSGDKDNVYCYVEGHKLFNWGLDDNPFETHAKYYGDCPCVKSNTFQNEWKIDQQDRKTTEEKKTSIASGGIATQQQSSQYRDNTTPPIAQENIDITTYTYHNNDFGATQSSVHNTQRQTENSANPKDVKPTSADARENSFFKLSHWSTGSYPPIELMANSGFAYFETGTMRTKQPSPSPLPSMGGEPSKSKEPEPSRSKVPELSSMHYPE